MLYTLLCVQDAKQHARRDSRTEKWSGDTEPSDASKFRLLGHLPSLGGAPKDKAAEREVQVALSLALQNQGRAGFMQGGGIAAAAGGGGAAPKDGGRAGRGADSKGEPGGGPNDIPKASTIGNLYACA